MTGHVIDELAALLTGGLSQDETRRVIDHLRECDECRRHLVSSAGANAALRSAALHAPELFDVPAARQPVPPPAAPPAPPPQSLRSRPRARRRRYGVAAGALVGAAAAVAAALVLSRGGGHSPGVTAQVALHQVAPSPSGSGDVRMRSVGQTTDMRVATRGLPALPSGRFYEVWLFDPKTGKMLAVGVLGPSGSGSFSISRRLLGRYQVVDISLQADNGDPAHSKTSVLRARYAT